MTIEELIKKVEALEERIDELEDEICTLNHAADSMEQRMIDTERTAEDAQHDVRQLEDRFDVHDHDSYL